ncbi:hypothetical protein ACKC9G_08410 [Pokkaliibacter sp. CJK22405]
MLQVEDNAGLSLMRQKNSGLNNHLRIRILLSPFKKYKNALKKP